MSWVVSESGPWFAQPLQHPEFPKVAAKAVAVPKADVALKAPAVPKAWKKVLLFTACIFSILGGLIADGLISKLSEIISESNSREEKDKSYNKLKREEVKQFLDTMNSSDILKAVIEIVLTAEDPVNILNLLLDGLGLSSNPGKKDMMFSAIKTIFKDLEIQIKMDRADQTKQLRKRILIIESLSTHSLCQLTKKQHVVVV